MHFEHDSYYGDWMDVNNCVRFAGTAKHEFGTRRRYVPTRKSPGALMHPSGSSSCDPAPMLDAAASYRFEVSALGNGTTHRIAWGAWSAHLDAATNAAPVVSGCTTTLGSLTGESNHAGSWTDACVSSNRPATRYARYYTFELVGAGELDKAADLTIELVSSQDTYLYLMNGAGTSGTEVTSNNDSQDDDLGYYNSRITYVASAGTYTIEATTVDSRATGDFTIRIDAALRHPSPPLNVRVIPGNNRLVVLWDPPASNAGSEIKKYKVEHVAESESSGSGNRRRRAVTDPSHELAASARGYSISGLDNGTSYSVTVRALNANSEGAPSIATGTPQATTITVTAPNTMDLAAIGDVGVRVDNPVAGADYKVRLSSDDAAKISFNGCDPQDDAEILQDTSSQANIQACAAGTAEVTALLAVQDAGGGYQTIAASDPPHEITVTPSTATLSIKKITGSDSLLTAGTTQTVELEGHKLVAGKSYDFVATLSGVAGNSLGFGSNPPTCDDAEKDASTTAQSSSATVMFVIRVCKPSTDVTFTASLKLDGAVLATATQVIKAKPKMPANLRAIGHSPTSTSGRITLRVDNPGFAVQYEVQTAACVASRSNGSLCEGATLTWDDATGGPHTPTNVSLTVPAITTTSPKTSIDAHEIVIDNVGLGDLYRVRVKAVFGGDDELESEETTDAVMVYTTDAQTDPRWVASVERKWYWTNRAYRATICTNLFSADSRFVPAIKAAMVSWQQELDWVVAGDNNAGSRLFSFLNPYEKNNCAAPTMASPGGTTDVSMPSSTAAFNDLCDAAMRDKVVACVLHAREDASNFVARVKAPMFFRPYTNVSDWFVTNNCTLFLDIATHEFGHVVGLSHSTSTAALMYDTSHSHCDPTPMDVASAVSLYQTRAQ